MFLDDYSKVDEKRYFTEKRKKDMERFSQEFGVAPHKNEEHLLIPNIVMATDKEFEDFIEDFMETKEMQWKIK